MVKIDWTVSSWSRFLSCVHSEFIKENILWTDTLEPGKVRLKLTSSTNSLHAMFSFLKCAESSLHLPSVDVYKRQHTYNGGGRFAP